MEKHMKASGIIILFVATLWPMAAEAHLRNFLATYGPSTSVQGEPEVELWTDWRKPDGTPGYWIHQTEVEYGVTDRWTTGLYGVFVEGQGFSAVKWENRYRLPYSVGPFDTAVYGEIQKANGGKAENELEGKLILGGNIGSWNLAANGILEAEEERQADGGKERELEPGLTIGAAYFGLPGPVMPGVELVLAENSSQIIPGAYISLSENVRLNLGAGVGLDKKADNIQYKSILEIEF